MSNMSQKQYTGPVSHRLAKNASHIPSHLLPTAGTKGDNLPSDEGLSKSQLDTVMMRFEALMGELNGCTLNSSKGGTSV